MVWLDWLILGILVYNLIGGLINGLLRSLVNLAALIGAYLLTPALKPLMISLVAMVFGLQDMLAVPMGIGLTWTAIYLAISLVGSILGRVLNKTPLKWLDRTGGALFGLLISLILILLPLAAIQSIPLLRQMKPVQETLQQSVCLPTLQPLLNIVQTTVGPAVIDYWLQQDKTHLKHTPLPQPSPSVGSSGSPQKQPTQRNQIKRS